MSFVSLFPAQLPKVLTDDYLSKMSVYELNHHAQEELFAKSSEDLERDLSSIVGRVYDNSVKQQPKINASKGLEKGSSFFTQYLILNLSRHYSAYRNFIRRILATFTATTFPCGFFYRKNMEVLDKLYVVPEDLVQAKREARSSPGSTPGQQLGIILDKKISDIFEIEHYFLGLLKNFTPSELNQLKTGESYSDRLVEICIIVQEISSKFNKQNKKAYTLPCGQTMTKLISRLFNLISNSHIGISFLQKLINKPRGNRREVIKAFFLNPNCSPFERTLIFMDSFKEGVDFIKELLKSNKPMATFETLDIDPVYSAVLDRCTPETVEFLGQTFNGVDTPDEYQQTPLHVAAAIGAPDLVSVLLKCGANPHKEDYKKNTPLLAACFGNHHRYAYYPRRVKFSTSLDQRRAACIEILLNEKSRLDVSNSDGHTPLAIARANHLYAVLEAILRARAKAKLTKEQESKQLYCSVRDGNLESVRLLSQYGASTNTIGTDSVTLLMAAQFVLFSRTDKEYIQNREEIYQIILKNVKDFNQKGVNGHTALTYALNEELLGLVLLMAEDVNFDINLSSDDGQTPLHHALGKYMKLSKEIKTLSSSRFNLESLEVNLQIYEKAIFALIKRKPALDAKDKFGVTPLMLAAQTGNIRFVQKLVEDGASTSIRDLAGKAAIAHINPTISQLEQRQIRDLLVFNMGQGTQEISNKRVEILLSHF